MKFKMIVGYISVLLSVVFLLPLKVFAVIPSLKLPLESGRTYQATVGYDGKSIFTNKDGTPWLDQWHKGNYYYAIDFDNPPNYEYVAIVAAADGDVESIYNDPNTGFGYGVRLKHVGDYRTIYAHFRSIPLVSKGDHVIQGQALGIMGTTGNSEGTHLHFELRDVNGITVKPEPMSGYTNFTVGAKYTSDNFLYPVGLSIDGTINQAIRDAYQRYGGYNKLGLSFNNGGTEFVHSYDGVPVQDYQHINCSGNTCASISSTGQNHYCTDGKTIIAFNKTLNRAFLIKEGFLGKCKETGCLGSIGPPTSEEYSFVDAQVTSQLSGYNMTRQNFQYGYFTYNWLTKEIKMFNSNNVQMFTWSDPVVNQSLLTYNSPDSYFLDSSTSTSITTTTPIILPYTTQFLSSSNISSANQPLDIKNTFVKGDNVYLWFKLLNVTNPVAAKAKIYFPNGNLAFITTWNSVPASQSYDLWTTSQTIMEDLECNGNSRSGKWTVELYLDTGNGYQLKNTNYFTVDLPATVSDIYLTASSSNVNLGEAFTLNNIKFVAGTPYTRHVVLSLIDCKEKLYAKRLSIAHIGAKTRSCQSYSG